MRGEKMKCRKHILKTVKCSHVPPEQWTWGCGHADLPQNLYAGFKGFEEYPVVKCCGDESKCEILRLEHEGHEHFRRVTKPKTEGVNDANSKTADNN